MKKIAPIVAIALGAMFTSCKKDYTCTCTMDNVNYPITLKDVKKKDAKDACNAAGSIYILGGGSCSLD